MNDVNAQFELEVNGEKQSFKVGECLSDDKKRDRLFEYLCYVKEEKIWGNEKEWRLFAGRHISEKQNSKIEYKENGYLIPIPEGAIKSVTFLPVLWSGSNIVQTSCFFHVVNNRVNSLLIVSVINSP